MNTSQIDESELLLPPWPQRRRRLVTVIMIGFILLASGLIGLGIYQVGIGMGLITPPLNKELLTKLLLTDASFLRAVKQESLRRECQNDTDKFRISYQAPFRPLTTDGAEACLVFVAVHPTGTDVLVKISSENATGDELAAKFSTSFSTIHTDLISGSGYETTRLTGVRNNIQSTTYIIRVDADKTWVVTYEPTSPTLDSIVLGMVGKFQAL